MQENICKNLAKKGFKRKYNLILEVFIDLSYQAKPEVWNWLIVKPPII